MFGLLTKYFLGLVVCTSLCGCSNQPAAENAGKSVEELNQANSKEELKNRLLELAKTGEAGSGVMGMRESIEEIRKSDPGIKEDILKLCDQLESEGTPSKVKSIAKKMADML